MLKQLEVDGFILNYCDVGDGPSTIVIGSSIYYPRVFSQQLQSSLRMIFCDHRGFGHATKPPEQSLYEFDCLVDDIETLRIKLGQEKIIIMGHSGHGHIALAYAKKYPHAVSHVVMIALSPDSSKRSIQAADQYLEDSVCPKRKAIYAEAMSHLESDIKKDPDNKFLYYSLRSAARIWYDYNFDSSFLWEGVKIVPEVFDHIWGEVFNSIDITKGLTNLNIPIFLALGRYDYWNPPHLWETVRNQFNDLTIRVFEKSGHTPSFEQPELFDHELLNWLGLLS